MSNGPFSVTELESVRKKLHGSRGRLKNLLKKISGEWQPSARMDENNWIYVRGKNICVPLCKIRVLRTAKRNGRKSSPIMVEWSFPVGKIPEVNDFVRTGRMCLRQWREGVDESSIAADILDMQDAIREIQDIVENLPNLARLCHPDSLVNMAGEGLWRESSKCLRRKQKIT